MKNITYLLSLSLIAGALLTGCSDENTSDDTTPVSSSTPAPGTSSTPAPGTSSTPAPGTSTTPAPGTSTSPAPTTTPRPVVDGECPSALPC